MKEDKVLKQCPEAESSLFKCFLLSRGFKRVSYEKMNNKEVINLKNKFCDIKIENIFPYESVMDMPILGDVKYVEPQHVYFKERYYDDEIISFGQISNEPLNPNESYWHQEEYFDFRHIIKYNDKMVIITYQRPQHRSIFRSQPTLQLSYYENNYYTKVFHGESSMLHDAYSESCSSYSWEEYMKKNYATGYCHYYDECAFADIYKEAERLLGIKLGYRRDLALKYLMDKKSIINKYSEMAEHSRRLSQRRRYLENERK